MTEERDRRALSKQSVWHCADGRAAAFRRWRGRSLQNLLPAAMAIASRCAPAERPILSLVCAGTPSRPSKASHRSSTARGPRAFNRPFGPFPEQI